MKPARHHTLLLLLAAVALFATTAAVAAAASPTKETSFASFSFEDTTTCPGITITQSNEERDTFIEFSPTSPARPASRCRDPDRER